jgi:hypothetical protein
LGSVKAPDQSVVNKHVEPFVEDTFGCQTFVKKVTRGGTTQYISGSCMFTSNAPPSNGVPIGPGKVPRHDDKSHGFDGSSVNPSGNASSTSRSSRKIRFDVSGSQCPTVIARRRRVVASMSDE